MKSTLILAALTLCALFSCKKNSTDEVLTKTEYLTKGTWKLTKIEQKYLDEPYVTRDINSPTSGYQCYLDDITTFRPDNSKIYDRATVKCNNNEVRIVGGTWSFNTDESVLNIDNGIYRLEALDANTLVYYRRSTDYTIRETYSH